MEELIEWKSLLSAAIHISNIAPDNITALRDTYLKEGLVGAINHLRSYYSCSLEDGENIIRKITEDLSPTLNKASIFQNITDKELLEEAQRRGLI